MSARAPAVWLSRPVHRARALAAQLEERGFFPILRPAIVIRDFSPDSLPPALPPAFPPAFPPASPVLSDLPAPPEKIHLAIFVSAEAVSRQPSPQNPIPALAIGRSAANALRVGFPLAASPARDSEQLLAAPELQNIRGKNIAVFGGISAETLSPSPPLCAELERRGARVFPIAKYLRQPANPDNGRLARLARENILRAATAFSAESLRAMLSVADPENIWLRKLPLFVHHPAVAESAAQMRFSDIITDANMADAVAKNIQPS